MLKSNDLRIGNWVRIDDRYGHSEDIQITSIGPEEYGSEIMGDISPIVLTKEWLERANFEYDDYLKVWGINPQFIDMGGAGSVSYDFLLNVVDGHVVFPWQGKDLVVKYVHQLQNLYFILTEKELTWI